MTSLNLKKTLLAGTAIIAVSSFAGVAQAQTAASTLSGDPAIIDNGTTNANIGIAANNAAVDIDDDSDITVANGGSIGNTDTGAAASAIDITTNGGTENLVILVQTGGTISNDGTAASTIQSVAGSDVATLGITVEGALTNTSNNDAIDTAGVDPTAATTVSVNAGGVITGNVNLGVAGTTVQTVNVADTGSITGNVTLGAGDDIVTISGTGAGNVGGNIVGAAGNDTVTISNSSATLGGTINLGTDGSDTVNVNVGDGNTLTLIGANVVTADEIVVQSGTLDIDAGDVSNSTALTLGVNASSNAATVRVDRDSAVTGITVDEAAGSTGTSTLNVDTTSGNVAGFGAIGGNNGLDVISVTGGANAFVVSANATATTINIADDSELELDAGDVDANIVGTAGVNTLNIDGGNFLNGAANTALLDAGADAVDIAGGTVGGTTLDLGADGDTLTVSGGSLNTTTVNLGAGTDTIALSGGTIGDAGTDSLDGGDGTDTINVTGSAAIGSAISNIEDIDVSGTSTLTLTGGIAGTATLDYDTATDNAVVLNGTGETFAFGAVTGLAGADTLTLTDGTFTATSVDLGAGANVINVTAGQFGASANDITVATGADGDTLNVDAGTVNSNFNLGDGSNIVDLEGATIAGNITLGTGSDTVTLNGTTLNGTLDMGNAEAITIDGGTVNINNTITNVSDIDVDATATVNLNVGASGSYAGTITGGTGGDQTVVLQTGTYTGAVDLDDDADALTVNAGATFDAAYTGGTGADTIVVNSDLGDNATFDDAGGTGSSITLNETQTLAATNDIDGFGLNIANNATVTVNTTDGLGHSTALDFLDIAAGSTLIANTNVNALTGLLTNDGTIRIVGASQVSADAYAGGAGSWIEFEIGAGNTSGKVIVTNGNAADFSNTSIALLGAINIGATYDNVIEGVEVTTADFANDPDTYLYNIEFSGDGANTDAAVTANNSVSDGLANDGNLAGGDEIVSLIGTGAVDEDLQTYLDSVAGASTGEAFNNLVEAGLPAVEGGAFLAAVDVSQQTNQIVDGQLASLRGYGNASGASSGDLNAKNVRAWTQVFGSTGEQDDRDGVQGFEVDSFGVSFGADAEVAQDVRAGIAVSYAQTEVDSDDASSTETEIDTYAVSLYGEYELDQATYVNGQIGYAFAQNDVTRVSPSVRSFDYDSHTFTVAAEAGRNYDLGHNVNIVPRVGLSYLYYTADEFTDPVAGGVSTEYDDMNRLEGIVGFDLQRSVQYSDGSSLTPYVSAEFGYDFIGDEVESAGSFVEGNAFATDGFEAQDERLTLGTGVNFLSADAWEFRADYEYEFRDDFDSHSGRVRAAYNF